MRRLLRYDYKAYLLCLATAACFWVLNAMGGNYETTLSYPVRFVPDSISAAQSVIRTNVEFSAKGSGWELLKRNLIFKYYPLVLPMSFVKGREAIPATEFLSFITPSIGRLSFRHLVTDSVELAIKNFVQKKVFLNVDPSKLTLKSPYRLRGKVYLEPEYITVTGSSSMVLKLPDTLNLLMGKTIDKGLDTLLDLTKLFSAGIKVDYNKAHLIFEVAPFVKRERMIEATLVDFPYSVLSTVGTPSFKMEYYVLEDNLSVENKANFKIILDYNMLDTASGSMVPVLVDFPDYIRDYTVSPPLFKLGHAK